MIVTSKAFLSDRDCSELQCLLTACTVVPTRYSQLQEIMVKFAFVKAKPQPIRVHRESHMGALVRQN